LIFLLFIFYFLYHDFSFLFCRMLRQAITAMEHSLQLQTSQQATQPEEAEVPPVDLLCPITLKLLDDPVILVDSAQTYEREAIQEWLDRGNRKDPVSGGYSHRV
jgi:hypothetical protein